MSTELVGNTGDNCQVLRLSQALRHMGGGSFWQSGKLLFGFNQVGATTEEELAYLKAFTYVHQPKVFGRLSSSFYTSLSLHNGIFSFSSQGQGCQITPRGPAADVFHAQPSNTQYPVSGQELMRLLLKNLDLYIF